MFFEDKNETMDLNKMVDLDLTDEQSKQLIGLVPNENNEDLADEVEFRVFQLAKKLKKNQSTISSSTEENSQTKSEPPTETDVQSTLSTTVKIKFYCRISVALARGFNYFTLDVDMNSTVDQLIKKLNSKRLTIVPKI